MTDNPDLFGRSPAQGSLFGSGQDRLQAPSQQTMPDPEDVRRRLNALLQKARSAERMPWSERDARMAKWLPEDEAGQLCFEFAQQMDRLSRAA
jgi:hypothetical protein